MNYTIVFLSKTVRKNLLHKIYTFVCGFYRGNNIKEREELLRQLISRAKGASEKKKHKRVIRTFLVFSGVVYLAAQCFGAMSNIEDYLIWLVAAPVLAGLIMFGAIMLLLYIHNGAMEDTKYIASLEGELNATVRFNIRKNKDEL